jgi:hypothetical protein
MGGRKKRNGGGAQAQAQAQAHAGIHKNGGAKNGGAKSGGAKNGGAKNGGAKNGGNGGKQKGGDVKPPHRQPAVLRVLKLNDDSNEQLDKLFSMIDADRNGHLQLSDFEILASKAAIGPMVAKTRSMEYFTKLQQELDADNDGRISKEEFYRGIIKLALQKPAGPMLHSLAGSSDLSAVMAACEIKTNFEVQELCKVLYNWMCGLVRE